MQGHRRSFYCRACTYHNRDGLVCEICGTNRDRDADAPQPWVCPMCTFHNRQDREACEICDTAKPERPDLIFEAPPAPEPEPAPVQAPASPQSPASSPRSPQRHDAYGPGSPRSPPEVKHIQFDDAAMQSPAVVSLHQGEKDLPSSRHAQREAARANQLAERALQAERREREAEARRLEEQRLQRVEEEESENVFGHTTRLHEM